MTQVKAQTGKIIGRALVRDKHGNPKVDKQALKTFWPYLTESDKAYLKTQYEEIQTWR